MIQPDGTSPRLTLYSLLVLTCSKRFIFTVQLPAEIRFFKISYVVGRILLSFDDSASNCPLCQYTPGSRSLCIRNWSSRAFHGDRCVCCRILKLRAGGNHQKVWRYNKNTRSEVMNVRCALLREPVTKFSFCFFMRSVSDLLDQRFPTRGTFLVFLRKIIVNWGVTGIFDVILRSCISFSFSVYYLHKYFWFLLAVQCLVHHWQK